MKLIFASDHAGYDLKQRLILFVRDLGYEADDMGAHVLNKNDDYTDFIPKAASAVDSDPENCRAIILGKTGQGEAMAANRFSRIRAAVYYGGDVNVVKLSREHNDSNVLSLGAHFLDPTEAEHAVKMWLETAFSDEERHKRRIRNLEG